MDEVHEWRYLYKADLVHLIGGWGETNAVGWLLESENGSPEFGFSASPSDGIYLEYVFIHELGHNMGMHHPRNNCMNPATSSGGLFDYSTGWIGTDVNGASYGTVMAYRVCVPTIPAFSNPDIRWDEGTYIGSYVASDPYAPSDNARTLREIKHVIANYNSKLKPVSINTTFQLPREFVLYQNYPNPFNPTTTIEYALPRREQAKVSVFDILGREVAVLENQEKDAGNHKVKFDGRNLASGIYFYRLQAGEYSKTKKFLLLK